MPLRYLVLRIGGDFSGEDTRVILMLLEQEKLNYVGDKKMVHQQITLILMEVIMLILEQHQAEHLVDILMK